MDPKLLRTHAKKAGGIAILGMAVPFALGVAISRVMFNILQGTDPEFQDVNFTSFYVFVGTAMSVTAFPVLARMLKEGGLIYTKPGALAMGAAALNDAIAWCLLVLAISIANAGNLGTAGYVFLSVCAFAVGLVFVVRPIFAQIVIYVERKHSSVMNNHLFALTLCLLFLCAWITALVGVHAIFGAFMFGMIVPRGSHLFRQCSERIEELVLTFTLPLYFALSGLSTDITLIRTAEEGAIVVLVCVMASLGKFVGGGGAALIGGMSVRESSVVAVLMNTRGLVELIVLNLGLDSKILSRRTFTVLVLMCLFTTCITSPLIDYIYPAGLRLRANSDSLQHLTDEEREAQRDGAEIEDAVVVVDVAKMSKESRVGLVVDCMDQLQGLINVLACFVAHSIDSELSVSAMHFIEPTHTTKDEFLALNENGRLIRVDEETTDCVAALRYLEDPSVKTPELLPLSMFCRGMGSAVNAFRIQGDPDEFPLEMKRLTRFNECTMVLMPWRAGSLYASKLFWGSIHIIGSPILLTAQKQPAVRRNSEAEERARARTNSVLSTSDQYLRGRNNPSSMFSGNAMAFMFETDDLEAPPPSSSFTSHVQLYNASTLSSGPTSNSRQAGGKSGGLSKLSKVVKTHIEIVAVVTGRPMDVLIFPMLLRFAEGKTNSITVHIPADFELFDQSVLAALQFFRRETELLLPNVRLEFLERVISTDIDSLFRLAAEIPFDFCISSFVEPGPSSSGATSDSVGDTSTAQTAFRGVHRMEQRLQTGMPVSYAHSDLTYPELGELGNLLWEMPSSKACQVLVLHESHKMHFARIAHGAAAVSLPIVTTESNGSRNGDETHQQATDRRVSKELTAGVSTRVTINDIGFSCDDDEEGML
eukprot:gene21429-27459_t